LTLPTFPTFKKLELSDKRIIDSFTNLYKPYSDFNFTNLWAWDTTSSREISLLNKNLVVRFTDYRETNPFLSFIGTNQVNNTVKQLLSYISESTDLPPVLKFVSEEAVMGLDKKQFLVEEDPENFDYIFSVRDIASSAHPYLRAKNRLSKNFSRDYPKAILEIRDFSDTSLHQSMIEIMHCWEINKKLANKIHDLRPEECAIKRLFNSANKHQLILTCLYNENVMIGFSVDEILPNSYAISHFIKADIQYRGVYEYLNKKVAQDLDKKDINLWNWEQDLNLEGLRQLKMSYRPISFLKKYRVSTRQNDMILGEINS